MNVTGAQLYRLVAPSVTEKEHKKFFSSQNKRFPVRMYMQETKFLHKEWKEMAEEVLASEEMRDLIRECVGQVTKNPE